MKPFYKIRQKWSDKQRSLGEIGMPTNVEKILHVEFDPQTGKYIGMPLKWQQLISESNFTDEERQNHPQEILDAVKVHDKLIQEQEQKELFIMGVSRGSLDDQGFSLRLF